MSGRPVVIRFENVAVSSARDDSLFRPAGALKTTRRLCALASPRPSPRSRPASLADAAAGVSYREVRVARSPEAGAGPRPAPASYDREPARRYPVLYFLHDAWSDETALDEHGVAAGAPAPHGRRDASGVSRRGARARAGSWFSDSHDGKELWERFLTADLPAQIEARYRAIPSRARRGITGISMGGYGAVKLALKHPDLYGSVSALSGALIPFGPEDLARYSFLARWTLKRVFGRVAEGQFLPRERRVGDPRGPPISRRPPFRSTCGAAPRTSTGWGASARSLPPLRRSRASPRDAVIEPGGHDWDLLAEGDAPDRRVARATLLV